MPLNKETTDQIRKEAEEKHYLMKNYQRVYIDAAEHWAVWKEKAEGAMEALEKCKPFIEDMQKENYNEPGAGISYDNKLEDAFNSLAKALEQFK